jgi:hypothetical protein
MCYINGISTDTDSEGLWHERPWPARLCFALRMSSQLEARYFSPQHRHNLGHYGTTLRCLFFRLQTGRPKMAHVSHSTEFNLWRTLCTRHDKMWRLDFLSRSFLVYVGFIGSADACLLHLHLLQGFLNAFRLSAYPTTLKVTLSVICSLQTPAPLVLIR